MHLSRLLRPRLRAPRAQRGFTLLEAAVAAMLLGIMSVMLSPTFRTLMTAKDQSYKERAALVNTKISQAMLDWAEQQSTSGMLPDPVNQRVAGGINYGPADPATAGTGTAYDYIIAQGVPASEVLVDSSAQQRVRVYQRTPDLFFTTPFYFQSGPQVTLRYQFGAVYQSTCNKTGTCNGGSQIPSGGSTVLDDTNYATWAPNLNLVRSPAVFSNLPLQKKMLAMTTERMDRVRDALTTFYRARVLSASASDTTNWYPAPTGTGAANLSGNSPALNQGCYDGWYQLYASNVNVLEQLGLSKEEFSRTAWGGLIEYCRDYDPLAGGANTAPHYAAIRIRKDVGASNGLGGDSLAANNIILSF